MDINPPSDTGISVDVDTGLEVKPDAPTLLPFIAGEAAAAAEVAPPPQVDREGVAVTKEGAAAVTTTNTTATTQQAQMPPLPSKFIPTGRYPAGTFGLPELVIPPKWLIRFEELKRYHDSFGHCRVPQNYEQNKQLGMWVRTQKQQYKLLQEGKANHLSNARIELLNQLGFEWTGKKRSQFWDDRYQELKEYHRKNDGSTRVPEHYPEAPQLNTWVSLQRRQLKLAKEGKKNNLTENRIRLLEELGLECQIRSSSSWMERFLELKEYKALHGNTAVPQKYIENPSLGRWVDNQKTQHKKLYDGKTTNLTIERIQLLVSIGFNFR
mmetsp:Transcript_486/g.1154  ORF Transcript_486/g.1154 Transcript_486/m.1154 type:complete len:324 (+) Transcript_486:112-1083(+)